MSFVVRNDQAGSTVDVSKQLDHAGLTAERPVSSAVLCGNLSVLVIPTGFVSPFVSKIVIVISFFQ